MRILYNIIHSIVILIITGTFFFLNIQDDRIFERIIAQQDISINKVSLLQNNQTNELSIHNKNVIVQLLANHLETKLNKSAAILEIVSKLPQIRTLPNASLIDPSFHGIPIDADILKRQVAHNILSSDKEIEVVFFVMPNGDMYFEEPYLHQENLTRDNFAFRDYYKGAISTGDIYLGDLVISAASGHPQMYMAVPLYSDNGNIKGDNTENLIGLFTVGFTIFSTFNKTIQSLPLSENETAIYVDNNGQIIASSSPSSYINSKDQSDKISSLQSFNDVIGGKSGYNIENINDKDMLIVYAPVKFKSTILGVFYISPFNIVR